MFKIDGIAFFSKNRARMTEFYRDVMGLPLYEEAGPMTLFAPGVAHGVVGVFEAQAHPMEGVTLANDTEIWFHADEVDAAYEHLRARGADIVAEPKDFPFGRAFWLRDPEGRMISVFRPA